MSLRTLKLASFALAGLAMSLTAVHAFDVSPQGTPDFPIVVSNPMPVDVPRPHIDPQSAPQLVHYAHNGDVDDVVLGKDKKVTKTGKRNASTSFGLDCSIDAGDLLLVNLGGDIAAGAKVKWRAAGDKGAIALPRGLMAGQQARINDAVTLNSGNCSAEVI